MQKYVLENKNASFRQIKLWNKENLIIEKQQRGRLTHYIKKNIALSISFYNSASAIKRKLFKFSFCIALGLHFAIAKLGGASAIKRKLFKFSFCIALGLH